MNDRLRALWRAYVHEVRDDADRAAAATRKALGASEVSRRTTIVTLTAIAALFFVRFAGNENKIDWAVDALDLVGLDEAGKKLAFAIERGPDRRIWERVWWAVGRVLGYGVIPLLSARYFLGLRFRDLGGSARGFLRHPWIYVGLIVAVMPLVVAVSYGDAFQAKYPYYRLHKGEPLWPNFLAWEALYAAQFVALELYFRGFLVNALKPLVGYASIFVMMIPYAMIHFGKPLPEALGSVFTGFLLGTLALKHRTIWGGALVHVSVACSMDFLSVWQRGRL